MNTDIPLHKRRSMHAAMLDSIKNAEQMGISYQECIPEANEVIKAFNTKVKETLEKLK